MHNRWNCPQQSTHYLANANTCHHCKCYVCNIALDICGVNSHKWAAPLSVLNWDNMRPRVQEWTEFDGIPLFSRKFRILAVNTELMIQKTGVEAENVVRYMQKPVSAGIWNYLQSAVRVVLHDELTECCQGYRDSTILSYMGHLSYLNMRQIRGNMIASLQWVLDDTHGNYLKFTMHIRRSSWSVSYLHEFNNIPTIEPPTLSIAPILPAGIREMFPHQQMALRDMLFVEEHSLTHSLWSGIHQTTVYIQKNTPRHQGSNISFFLQDYNCISPDGMIYGGLLCNEKGTGKTYVMAALIYTHRAPNAVTHAAAQSLQLNQHQLPSSDNDSSDDTEAAMDCTAEPKQDIPQTLVVVPAANLIQQWVHELEMLNLKVFVHHGRTRVQTLDDLQHYDVIVTTFDTLRTLWFGAKKTIFHRVNFWRIIWDECHRLLQGQSFTRAGVAAVEIGARNRWGLTATPDLTVSRSRLYAQLISGPSTIEGIADNSLVHRFILHPERYSNEDRLPIIRALTIMHNAGDNIMPDISVNRYAIRLENMTAYNQIIQRVRHTGNRFGGMYLMRVFNNLLANLNGVAPMKWPAITADHNSSEECPELPPDVYECSICLDALRRPTRSDCQHYFCLDCINRWLENSQNCPLCRSKARPLVACAEIVDFGGAEESELAPSGAKAAFLIAKIEEILALPNDMRQPHRILVFSRYMSTRQLLMNMLGPVATTDIAAFQNGSARVLIMSFLSGSVGLNLMQANHVILCEPCFRTSTEEQAIGRAARLGQKRVVHVHYVTMQDTVEDTMTELPRHARLSIQNAFGL